MRIKRILPVVLLVLSAACVPISAEGTKDIKAAAHVLGRFILSNSRETTYGLRYPEYTKEGEAEYHDNLYKGAAGVGLTLLDLFQAFKEPDHFKSATQVGYDLIESTPGRHFIHPGLYTGQAGHVLFYLHAAQTLKDPVFAQEASGWVIFWQKNLFTEQISLPAQQEQG